MRKGTWRVLCRLGMVLLAVGFATASARAQPTPISITELDTLYEQNFDSLPNSGGPHGKDTLPEGWDFSEFDPPGSGSSPNDTYGIWTNTTNAGNTYSFGQSESTDRAFGGLLSNSVGTIIGAEFRNDSGSVVTSVTIQYTGEQWRLGAIGREDRLDFEYSLDASSLTTGEWEEVNDLDFVAPIQSGTVGGLDGNAAANRDDIEFTITGLSLAGGDTIWIRWTDFNATGSDDALAVDDFKLTAHGAASAPLTITKSVVPSATPIGPGVELTYTLVVTHTDDSPGTLAEVEVTDQVPAGVTFVAGSLKLNDIVQADPTDDTVFVEISDLAKGAPSAATIEFKVTIDGDRTESAAISNTASAYFLLDDIDLTDGTIESEAASVDVRQCLVVDHCPASYLCVDVVCSDLGSCVEEFTTDSCDDSDPCTEDDACFEGECLGAPKCVASDACMVASCDAQGDCSEAPIDCDDGDTCTTDTCDAGTCVFVPSCATETGFPIAIWTFETSPPSLDNSTTISGILADLGTGTASGVHASALTDYTNPVGNGSTESFSSNEWASGDYYEFQVSTVGLDTIMLSWDQTRSSTGPSDFALIASVDGEDFQPISNNYTVNEVTWSSTPPAKIESHFGPIALGPMFADQTTVYVRMVSASQPGGTNRVDNVNIGGLPINGIPHLEAIKDDNVTLAAIPDDIFVYSIVVDHNETSTHIAVDVEIMDQLPEGVTASEMQVERPDGTIVPITLESGDDGGEISEGGLITVRLTDLGLTELGLTESVTLSVFVTVDPRTTAANLANTAALTWKDIRDGGPYAVNSNTLATPVAECVENEDCLDLGQCMDTRTCNAGICEYTYLTTACDDGDECTVDDTCTGPVCEGTTRDCDDQDECTTDSCNSASGCVNDTITCSDGVGCTADTCDPDTGCVFTPVDANCNDTNPCTDDVCDPVDDCVNTNDNTNTCADANLCNGNETCVNGTCTAGTAVVCNDNNPCTNDSCNPATGLCAFANNTDTCNDNNANTHTDTCTSGTCVGTAVVCDTPNQCQTIGTPNGTASCPPVNKVNGTACDDNSLTTHTDVCTAGVCAGTTIVCPAPGTCELAGTPNGVDCTKNFAPANTPCNDDDLTTATDVCDGAGVCAGTTIVCPTPTQCQTAGTPDGTTCVPVNKPATEPCDDGDVATSGDTCDGAGACVGTAIVCPEDTACGTYAPNGVDCTLTPLTGACDDGDVNTHTDTCVEGSCQGTAYACVPSQCELDSVANGTDCTVTFKDADTACDDGDVNTRDDVCDGAGTCAGDAYTCTPGVCEASSVPDGTGCVVTPSLPGDACEDGDPCTIDDVCDTAGLCMGEAVVCGDGELCGDDGTCRLTHCTTCAEDIECGANSTCVALDVGSRCLVGCENDLDCALNQTCAATEDGAMHCFDLSGACAAPVVDPEEDPEVVEPGPEIAEPEPEPEQVEPEPEPEETEPQPEETEEEPGPEPVETAEPVEPAPDAAAEAEDDKVVASGGGCSGGGASSGALALLVGALALAEVRRRLQR